MKITEPVVVDYPLTRPTAGVSCVLERVRGPASCPSMDMDRCVYVCVCRRAQCALTSVLRQRTSAGHRPAPWLNVSSLPSAMPTQAQMNQAEEQLAIAHQEIAATKKNMEAMAEEKIKHQATLAAARKKAARQRAIAKNRQRKSDNMVFKRFVTAETNRKLAEIEREQQVHAQQELQQDREQALVKTSLRTFMQWFMRIKAPIHLRAVKSLKAFRTRKRSIMRKWRDSSRATGGLCIKASTAFSLASSHP